MEQVEDPELKELAAMLPEVVLRGRAPSTVKMYSGALSIPPLEGLGWEKDGSVSVPGCAI